MVQAYIEGPVVACDFLADRGRVLCSYHSSGLDTDCPDGTGMVVLFRSEPANSVLETALADFVRATHYTGPGLLQCVRCERSNQLYFIEVNPRLSAGIEESVQSGLDMPLLNLQIALDQADNVSPAYQPGRVSYWMERDLQGWLRQRGQMNLRQHVRKLGQVIGRLSKCHGHINWQISDPLPACLAMLRMLRSGFHASRSDTTQKTAPDTTHQAVTRVAGSAPPTHYPLKDVHPN